jgi:molecular chaperone GrpE
MSDPRSNTAGRPQSGPVVARPDAERAEAGAPEATEPQAPDAPPEAVSGARTEADAPAAADAAGEAAAPDNGATESEADHERNLELDLQELEAKAEKADEYLELAKRTKADFENFRKRAAREAAAAQARGVIKLAKELLPAVDNLDRAVKAADGAEGDLFSGIKLVHAEVLAALARVGIEPYSPEGEPFDPQRHEAVAQQPVEGAEPGTIVEVYQRGYRIGESVLRPARVVVAG